VGKFARCPIGRSFCLEWPALADGPAWPGVSESLFSESLFSESLFSESLFSESLSRDGGWAIGPFRAAVGKVVCRHRSWR
jgi:hypothetical protein